MSLCSDLERLLQCDLLQASFLKNCYVFRPNTTLFLRSHNNYFFLAPSIISNLNQKIVILKKKQLTFAFFLDCLS